MLLDDSEVRTREVTTWQGLHLLHFDMSSCSQKVRILTGELGIEYVSHPINLMKNEQRSEWYLGINQRGVVPVLVHDGQVHIESNDIIEYLNRHYGTQKKSFLPLSDAEQKDMRELMDLEDSLHVDLRMVTFTYLAPNPSGDAPILDDSFAFLGRFHDALTHLNERLKGHEYLIGNRVTLADISWYITLHRLYLAGYPLHQYPVLADYFHRIKKRPAFSKQVVSGPVVLRFAGVIYRVVNRMFKHSLKKDFKHWQSNRLVEA